MSERYLQKTDIRVQIFFSAGRLLLLSSANVSTKGWKVAFSDSVSSQTCPAYVQTEVLSVYTEQSLLQLFQECASGI